MTSSNKPVEIRRMTGKELDAVLSLFNEVLAEELATQYPPPAREHYRDQVTRDALGRRIKETRQILLVALREGGVVGTTICGPIVGGVVTIEWVIVDPTQRRQGIGSRLIDGALDRASALGAHKAQLFATDPSAIEFHRACGFEDQCVLPDHWWGGEYRLLVTELG